MQTIKETAEERDKDKNNNDSPSAANCRTSTSDLEHKKLADFYTGFFAACPETRKTNSPPVLDS